MLHPFLSLLFPLLLVTACVSDPESQALPPPGPMRCEFLAKQINWKEQVKTLDSISILFHNACYEDTIKIGSKARESYRFKTYSILQESAEFFLAEGTVTDYVMESYERGYLSFLILLSYVHRGDPQAVTVELNRFYSEEVASLYNYGQDPINALLQATLWENYPIEGFSSRPFWLWISNAVTADKELRNFASARVKDFDAKIRHAPWHISEVGTFPALEWSMTFTDSKSGYFNIKPKKSFEPACSEPTAILVPTSSWFHKIAMRHSKAYHPLVNAKSWIRLPIGILYGITTATAGAGLMVGGCALDAGSKGDGALCKVSIQGGVAIMAQSDDIVDYALRPDLRHWQKLPEALFISSDRSLKRSRCRPQAEHSDIRSLL